MLKEVYLSLLQSDEIANTEGYIWRICQHTYARYVSEIKKKQGIAIDGMEIAWFDRNDFGETEETLAKLRKEIAFLTAKRRKIVYSFYYEDKAILQIAREQDLPAGTVKWHLNKARNDLKEGFSMERRVGNLGINPIQAQGFGHRGKPGTNGGPEYYLKDKLNLNIVYSVYYEPKTLEEIAEELGMTPVFLEDRVNLLTANGFLVETAKKRFTTYVKFSPQKISAEMEALVRQQKSKAAHILAEKYVPEVRASIRNFDAVYIPGGNRELFEAAAVFYGISRKCDIPIEKDVSKCMIKTLDGGDYFAQVQLNAETGNTENQCCGIMVRESGKYPCVSSWSIDSRLDTRTGTWMNTRTEDFEYVYEAMTGVIADTKANAEKYDRLYERHFLSKDAKINIMVVNGTSAEFDALIPSPCKEIMDQFAGFALDQAVIVAKDYPPQLQDLVIADFVRDFIGNQVALMVMDILYENRTFKPLAESEKVTANLMMFADMLPGNV